MRQFRGTATACALAAVTALGTAPAIAGTATTGWAVVPSPNPAGASSSVLSAVACSSTSSCWAVGNYATNTSDDFTLAEQWNGSKWSIGTTPNAKGATDSLLSGVSCAGPNWCSAVGYSVTLTKTGEIVRALVEAWNGKTWAIQPTPLPKGSPGWLALDSVSCTAPGSCTAVGGLIGNGVSAQEQPLAEHWNGTAWAIQPTPNPMAENGSSLVGVSCTASNACTAGGDYDYADVDQSIFAMRWNGTKWAMQNQPNPGGQFLNSDRAVSCTSATTCTVTGSWTDTANQGVPLAQGWNGTAWSSEHPASPHGNQSAALSGVSCAAAAACISVGYWANNAQGNPQVTLAEQWNGQAWAIQPTPNPAGAKISSLDAVACPSSAACVAAGSSWNGTSTQTLTETYTGA